MLEHCLKASLGIGRSKPFLLFVIILLTGFIYLHLNPQAKPIKLRNDAFDTVQIRFKQFTKLQPSANLSAQNGVTESLRGVLLNDTYESTDSEARVTRKCKKKIDVSFLKVHKAGSTTVMNIFLRFAISNKLNIVLPPKPSGFGFNYLGYGTTVSKDNIIPLPNNESYNVLCNHVVYDKKAFRSIMPEDTIYLGILREPKTHFRSAASYYGFESHLKTYAQEHQIQVHSHVLSEFLRDETQFKVGTYFVYNRMSFDFGIPKHLFHNDTFVDTYISELDRDYGLVMIMERFSESLVLLKRLLCWETKDILYVPLNARHSKSVFTFSDDDTTRLKRWNSADFKLYDHFVQVFDEKVKAGGPDLLAEVESFEEIQEMVKAFCISGKRGSVSETLTIPRTKWEESFEVSASDCALMTENELPMMQRLIKQAWEHYGQPDTEEQHRIRPKGHNS